MTTLYCPRGDNPDGYHSVKRPRFHPAGDELICDDHGCRMSTFKPRRSGLARSPSPAKPRKGMKRGKGFAASKAQREKVRGLACVGCGREASECWSIDAAHVTHRGVGGCQVDPLCVVPLCRMGATARGCHPAFDRGELDLLPRLIDNGYYAEMAHAIEAHELSPLTLLERLTGKEWNEADRSDLVGSESRKEVCDSQVPKFVSRGAA